MADIYLARQAGLDRLRRGEGAERAARARPRRRARCSWTRRACVGMLVAREPRGASSRSPPTTACTTSRWSTSTAPTCASCSRAAQRAKPRGARTRPRVAIVDGGRRRPRPRAPPLRPRRPPAAPRPPRRLAVEHHGQPRRRREGHRLRHRALAACRRTTPTRASCAARRATCRPSSAWATTSTCAPTCSRSASCSTS